MTYYVTIGNSDDKLAQEEWADYCSAVEKAIDNIAGQWEGKFYSLTNNRYQNANFAFSIAYPEDIENLKAELNDIRKEFDQDSIVFATAEVEFI